jgi:hypothetical protein
MRFFTFLEVLPIAFLLCIIWQSKAMMGTSTFGELSESLRFGAKQVNEASGKSSRSRERKSVVKISNQ